MFYVYEHWRPDTDVCFYVGKGKGRRAWNMSSRGRRHKAVQSKLISLGLAVDIRMVIENVSEETAFAVECDRIAYRQSSSLINQTLGGDGMSGHRHTAETKAKVSAARKGKPLSAEHRAKLSAAKKGRKQSAEMIRKRSEKLKGNTWNRGRPMHPKTREILRSKLIGNSYAKGAVRSPEHRAAIAKASAERIYTPEMRERRIAAQKLRRQRERNHAA